jgi:hypothetical protein
MTEFPVVIPPSTGECAAGRDHPAIRSLPATWPPLLSSQDSGGPFPGETDNTASSFRFCDIGMT